MDDFSFAPEVRCSFCGTVGASGYLSGPHALMCYQCARRQAQPVPVPLGTRCGLCGLGIGSRRGFLWRRRVTVALLGNGTACCAQCHASAREIAIEASRGGAAA